MQLTPSQGCCALYELHGFSEEQPNSGDKLEYFLEIYDRSYVSRGELGFVLFTDNLVSTHGSRLAQYLKRKKLGNVIQTAPKKNPKSGRQVQCWIWDIDWKALRAWEKTR